MICADFGFSPDLDVSGIGEAIWGVTLSIVKPSAAAAPP